MKIVMKRIYDLKPAEYNPRRLTKKQKSDLEKSIKRFGVVDPAIVNTYKGRENIIVGGHQRIRVAMEMGMSEFPCVEVSLNKDQERELNVRLNKNSGEWNFDELANLFEVDELIEWGFTEEDLFGNVKESKPNEENQERPFLIELDQYLCSDCKLKVHEFLSLGEVQIKLNGKTYGIQN